MRALGASRTSLVPGGVLAGPWVRDDLWRRARAVPSIDLRFADNKSLTDAVTGASLVTFTRASSGTFVGSAGVLQTAATDVPRFDHNPTTGESLGLLVEEQRTNLLLQSEDFSNVAWVVNAATVTTNTQTAPNGTLTADTFSPTLGTSSLHQIITCLASTVYTWTFYIKLGTMAAADFRFAVRDDSNGAFIARDIVPNVTPVTTEWRRVTYTFTTPVGCVLVRPYPYRFTPATYGTTVHLWGAQLEAGSFATSYIPTTTAAATRSADVASITDSAFSSWYRQDEGTVFSAFSIPTSTTTGGARVYSISNSGGTTQAWLRLQGGINRVYEVTDSSTQQAVLSAGAFSAGVLYRGAVALKTNDFGFSENGSTPTVDTSGTLGTVDRMGIGMDSSGTAPLSGHIRRLTFWPTRLSNEVLQRITQ
jgi:hypothetical protein